MKTYTKTVSATLAGALAVGMVPAMALADDAIELQAITDLAAVKQSTVIAYAGGANPETEVALEDADAYALLKPIAVVVGGAGSEELDIVDYSWAAYNPLSPAKTSGSYLLNGAQFDSALSWNLGTSMPTVAGNYVMRVKAAYDTDGDGIADASAWSDNCYAFTVVPKALTGELAVYEIVTDKTNVTDTVHVYDGSAYYMNMNAAFDAGKLGISLDGKPLKYGTDYVFDSGSKVKYAETNLEVPSTKRADAGDYYIEANFNGVYKKVYFSVAELDLGQADIKLSNAAVLVNDGTLTASSLTIDKINGESYSSSALKTKVAITGVSVDLASATLANGTYTATVGVTAAGAEDENIVAGTSQTLDFTVVGADLTGSLTLGYPTGTELVTPSTNVDGDVDYKVNRADAAYKASDEFDVSKLVVSTTDKTYTDYTLVVMKEDATVVGGWKAVDVSELTNKATFGTYKVKAVLNAAALKYAVAGETPEMIVEITNGQIADANVAFAYDGKNVTKYQFDGATNALTYSGENFVDGLSVVVKSGSTVIPASDYSVVVKKYNAKSTAPDKYDVVTDGIVNVGEYKVEVVSGKYEIVGDNAIYVDVKQAPVRAVIGDQIDHLVAGNEYSGDEFLYTGEAINPISAFFQLVSVGGADKVVNGKPVVVDVPAAGYKVAITGFTPEAPNAKPVLKKDLPTEFKAAGTYTYTLIDTDTAASSDNYAVEGIADGTLRITALSVFPDVKAGAWYADEVLTVAQPGWIPGSDNGLFGPNDDMTRGDLALVLCRALGLTAQGVTGTVAGDRAPSVETGFADVNGKAYNAWAIKAMAEAGIITGYADGSYGPSDPVTRQMLATVLARLDESGLGDESIMGLASALSAYADADEVAGWAAPGMEWAVEAGIIGVDTAFLNPTDPATRAEVAAMLLRYNAEIGGLKPVVVVTDDEEDEEEDDQ